MTDDEPTPVTECRICRVEVPDGEFCGLCGCHLTPRRWEGPDWLRFRNFGAAPAESLLSPSLTSSLFPQLPRRGAFSLALALIVLALVVFALLRLPAALIAVGVLGLPTLFLIYLREADAFRDLPGRTLALTVALGVLLGIGAVVMAGAFVAPVKGIALGVGTGVEQMAREGVAMPLCATILMLVPAIVVRLLGPPTREAMHGFMIGALGALMFTGTATLVRLIPQLRTGLVSTNSLSFYIVEAGIRGVALPLIAAASGGLIGAALWFTRPAGTKGRRPVLVRLVLVAFAFVIMALSVVLGLTDVSHSRHWLMLTLYLSASMLVLMLLRLSLHLALLHEAHDEIASDEPVLCHVCERVVPDMAFCPACGVAARAASQSSRTLRRTERPQRIDSGGRP